MKKIALIFLLLLAWAPHIRAQESFYQSQTIRMVVGFSAGGFYDRWARLVARHLGKHIPG
ncbi:MAG: hypothetical protein HYY83_09565, partial [Deltaproteobacteria bacterium]|nr:hypothetical protein [Deltaproteobacteria bacterium]